MKLGPAPKYQVIDQFLSSSLASALLDHALASEASFEPSQLLLAETRLIDQGQRCSLRSNAGLGALEAPFLAVLQAQFGTLCEAVGMPPFVLAHSEVELAAHGDGGFYKPHLDTFTQADRASAGTDRVLSAVYYLTREPHGWSGGDLQLHCFGGGLADRIAPAHNRLLAFPSIALHEVLPVRCPSGQFADYRFAINCWLHRARG